MMFSKVDYVFTPLSFLFLSGVELEILFSIYIIRHAFWFNSSSFK